MGEAGGDGRETKEEPGRGVAGVGGAKVALDEEFSFV